MKGLQSTFVMLTNIANKLYAEFLVKSVLMPDEYYPIAKYFESETIAREESQFKFIEPAPLELPFINELHSSTKQSMSGLGK